MVYFFFLFFIFFNPSFAQDTGDLIRILNPNAQAPAESDPNQSKALSDTQKKLLRKVIDSISDREVDEYLLKMGLPTSGSVYAKKIRLRNAIGADAQEKIKDELPKDFGEKKKGSPFIIENASEGELMSVDKTKGGVLILRGKVKLKVGEGTLTAELISVDSKKGELYAEGGIEYKSGLIEIKGDKFIYDVNLDRGVIYDTKANMYPVNFVGEKIKRIDENKFLLEMGYFTACNAEVPHYSFQARKIFIYEDKSIVASGMWMTVGGTKLFYTPLYYSSNLGSGWTFQFGQNRTQGKFLQASYQWSNPLAVPSLLAPVGRKIKLDHYEKTGTHVGFEFWKISPWLNYNLNLGVADFHKYQFAGRYYSINPAEGDLSTRFATGASDVIVTTNQVDNGEKCFEYNGKCTLTYNQAFQLYTGNSTTAFRDIGLKRETWFKGDLLANAKSNNIAADGTRNVQIRYEQFTNPRFDYEFGFRYEPANTLQSLYTNRNQRTPLIRQNLLWNLDYTETRGDLTVNVSARRQQTYYIIPQTVGVGDNSNFFPVRDELPKTMIRNSMQIATLPYFESPIYWDFSLNSLIARLYGFPVRKPLVGSPPPPGLQTDDPFGRYRENLLRTEYTTRIETGLRTNMNFGSYFTFSPGLYVGGNKQTVERTDSAQTATSSEISIERFFKRESYSYLRQNHRLSFGIPALLFSTTYRRTDARFRELQDPVLKDGRDAVHEAEFGLESNYFEDFEFSVKTIRDLRQFSDNYRSTLNSEGGPKDIERWYFTVFRMSAFFDFYNGFTRKRETLLERQRSFFSGIFLNNDFVYHTSQNRRLYNMATAGYQLGGFKFLFIRNIRSLEVGGSWYHVYDSFLRQDLGVYLLPGSLQQSVTSTSAIQAYQTSNAYNQYYTNTSSFQDMYRIYVRADLQFTRNFGFEWDADSRVTQPWRYTDQVGESAFYRNGQDAYTIAGTQASSTYQRTNPGTDIANGFQFGSDQSKNTAFNINRMMWMLKYNIHDFEYRLGYSMDLRAIAGGPTYDSQVTFYDQSVIFSVNLININLGPEETASQQTRARLYRFRKRPLDAGYSTGVSGQ
ncbi:MAG: LPS-assembly protein LptD [Leptospiraceae bacterium]|nr:LPS-assembly protein LptD [Leptospiraceae bacterium]